MSLRLAVQEQLKISEIFSKLSGGRGISASEAKVMYIKKVRKLPMYGTTLFHVHNSKIFPSGHFLIAANSSGVQFLHPVTKEELHSPFFFSDLQRWEYTPKVFSAWSNCPCVETRGAPPRPPRPTVPASRRLSTLRRSHGANKRAP